MDIAADMAYCQKMRELEEGKPTFPPHGIYTCKASMFVPYSLTWKIFPNVPEKNSLYL